MLRISRLTDYATIVLAHLARTPDQVQPAAQVASHAHLALPTVSKILKALARVELVTSFRGPQGGYTLARRPEQISAAQIIDAIEGPVAITQCSLEDSQCCIESSCSIGQNWQHINRSIRAALEEVSLAQLAGLPASEPLAVVVPETVMPEIPAS
jgi:FeS assembly SUF system regulator